MAVTIVHLRELQKAAQGVHPCGVHPCRDTSGVTHGSASQDATTTFCGKEVLVLALPASDVAGPPHCIPCQRKVPASQWSVG